MSEDVDPPEAEGVPPSISQLILDYQERTGRSLHQASEASLASGRKVAQSYLSNLKNRNAPGWPKDVETYSALATALETTELAIVLGFAVEHGVNVRMPAFASQLPPGIDLAPRPVRDAILALCWAVVRPELAGRRFAPDDVPDLTGVEGMIEDHGPDPTPGTKRHAH